MNVQFFVEGGRGRGRLHYPLFNFQIRDFSQPIRKSTFDNRNCLRSRLFTLVHDISRSFTLSFTGGTGVPFRVIRGSISNHLPSQIPSERRKQKSEMTHLSTTLPLWTHARSREITKNTRKKHAIFFFTQPKSTTVRGSEDHCITQLVAGLSATRLLEENNRSWDGNSRRVRNATGSSLPLFRLCEAKIGNRNSIQA